MELIPYGPSSLLVRFAQKADEAAFLMGRSLLAALQENPPAGLCETVPAFTSVLLIFTGQSARDKAMELPAKWKEEPLRASREMEGRRKEIVVHYEGPDLERVAARSKMRLDDVVRCHSEPLYRVHCLGFSPGFPYLGGLDPRLHTPRLASPRVRVPAGSVAIGGEQTGIYSVASPGGWNLIGTTKAPLFRPRAVSLDDMFLLQAGDQVQFFAGDPREATDPATASERAPEAGSGHGVPTLRVLASGLGLSIQDLGRPGFRRFGVPSGGVMDRHAAAWANRLLDNPEGLPLLELCGPGQRIEVLEDGWLAWTGGSGGLGLVPQPWSAFRVRSGEVITFPASKSGVWSYLAVPGGFVAGRVLGSVSANPRAGLGDTLGPGVAALRYPGHQFNPPSATASRRTAWSEIPNDPVTPSILVWPGPQWKAFGAAVRDQFFSSKWMVTSQCDRVGYRLQGPSLRSDSPEMISEPVLPGSIQVPPSGQPIVTMPDGPTLGGYPKLGLVDSGDLARLAQCRPGQRIRFIPAR